MTTRSGETVQDITAKLMALWESGDMPAAVAQTVLRKDRNDRPSDNWSFGNRLLMAMAGTEDARTYNQWQAVGRQVRRREDGGQAFYIYKPIKKTITVEDKTTGEKTKRPILIGFGLQPEFALEVTDGDPIIYPDYTPATMPPLAEVAQAWGVQVSYAPITRNAYGSYNQATDSIQMATHDVVSFFHELIHAGQKRALEARGRKLAPGQDPQQEIVAEAGAAALCILYGYEGFLVDSRTYVAHYAGVQDDPTKAAKAVLGTLNDIAEVLTLILDTAQAQAEQSATVAA